jgi:NAD(P)-dependent dehydrogenase (short-subunit alcohol dehydrogenase family)
MANWSESTAFITGGGSGIGRALAQALSSRGARVCVADINAEGAQRVAAECGERASAVELDVRKAEDVRAAISAFAAKAGRLDYVFNNAGTGVAGETEEIPLAIWQAVIDVNVYGVLHGVLAAYPIMLRQGYGHIINTASLAGLGPAPLLTPYALSKHAVVGLSTSLRIEAAPRGVRVSALCPAAIETPILAPRDATEFGIPWVPDIRRYLTTLGGNPYPVDKCAEETLAAIESNKAVIVLPARGRVGWRLGRLFPGLVERITASAVAGERRLRVAPGFVRPALPAAEAPDQVVAAQQARN